MGAHRDNGLRRHERTVAIAVVAGTTVLITFRVLIELGLAPAGLRRFSGLPIEYPFLGWFVALSALMFDRWRLADTDRLRATLYEWWLSILGVAGLFWLGTGLRDARLLGSSSWVYWFAAACVLSVFVSAASVRRTGSGLLRGVVPDFLRILGRPATWVCALVVFAIMGAAPRTGEIPAGGRAFERWYSRQARAETPVTWRVAAITLVELVDYQCPACRQADTLYKDVLRLAKEEYGAAFEFVRIDFPLENECNSAGRGTKGGLHLAACEAAAAVRLAKRLTPSREPEVVQWLWDHQRQMTRESLFDDIKRQFGLDVQPHYPELLRAISEEAAAGRALGVSGTPTFFLNGRRLHLMSPEALKAAIAIEARAAAANVAGGTP